MIDLFKIFETKDKGKCLFSTKKIELGQSILIEEPYSSVVSDHLIQTHCQFCLQNAKEI